MMSESAQTLHAYWTTAVLAESADGSRLVSVMAKTSLEQAASNLTKQDCGNFPFGELGDQSIATLLGSRHRFEPACDWTRKG